MDVGAAQREVREVYRNGSVGQLVSGAVWLASSAAATWGSFRLGVIVLVLGGFFIFPLTVAALRLAGSSGSLSPGNPLRALAMQIAFTVPLAIPLILAATRAGAGWFYPAFMIVVGAHYLPFAFLYGMRAFLVLGAAMVAGGWALGTLGGDRPTVGGWATAAALVAFGLWAARRPA
jgi:hypothetical protein